MSNWKQELAAELTPIAGVNDVAAVLTWNMDVLDDPFSPLPPAGGRVAISRTVQVKGLKEVDARLVDGKNYLAEDFITEIAFLKYLAAREPQSGDPEIVNNGKVKSLDDMRPLGENWGIRPVLDTLTIAGKVWAIADIQALGMMNDEATGVPAPAKLRLVLRGVIDG